MRCDLNFVFEFGRFLTFFGIFWRDRTYELYIHTRELFAIVINHQQPPFIRP